MATSTTAAATVYQHPPETNNGTVTSWVPVTTAYPSVSGCAESIWAYTSGANLAAWDPDYGIAVQSDLSCWPAQGTSWWHAQSTSGDLATTYSLGPVTCPEAYYTAMTTAIDASSTFIACCPGAFSFTKVLDARTLGECVSSLKSGQVITYASRTKSAVYSTTSTTITVSSTHLVGVQFNGWNFNQAVLTPTTVPIASTTQSSPSTSPTQFSSSGGGLSSGAKAGIGVGVTIAVLVFLAGLAIFFFRGRRRNRIGQPIELDGGQQRAAKMELEAAGSRARLVELRGNSISELGENGIASPPPIYELPEKKP